MVEWYTPLPGTDADTVLHSPAPSRESESATTIHIDEYRKRAQREVLRRMSHLVLAHYTREDTLSITPICLNYRSAGNMSVHYAEYSEGYPDDEYGVVVHAGWSGGPETKRIVVAQYDNDSDSVQAGLLLPRNLRYLESDLRAKRHTPEYESMIQAVFVQLTISEKEIKLATNM